MNSFGLRIEPCQTLHFTFSKSELTLFAHTFSYFQSMMTTRYEVILSCHNILIFATEQNDLLCRMSFSSQ